VGIFFAKRCPLHRTMISLYMRHEAPLRRHVEQRTMNEKSDGGGPFLTRRTGVKFVNEKLGVPLTKSTFDKRAMKGQTPRPDKFYGKTELYRPKTLEDWALAELCSNKPKKLGAA
jgi:hypothetical protein